MWNFSLFLLLEMQVDFIWRHFIHLRMLFTKRRNIELSFIVEYRIYGNKEKRIIFIPQALSITFMHFSGHSNYALFLQKWEEIVGYSLMLATLYHFLSSSSLRSITEFLSYAIWCYFIFVQFLNLILPPLQMIAINLVLFCSPHLQS